MDESGKEISGTRTTGLLKCPIAGLGYLYLSLCFPDTNTAGFVVDGTCYQHLVGLNLTTDSGRNERSSKFLSSPLSLPSD